MIRKIVQIEEDRCTGCGLCAHACHESAIAMVDGKAKLIRDDYCDGFGDCLPVCPADAISFVEREALPYDEEAVKENQRKAKEAAGQENTGAGKAGENSWAIDRADAQENSAAVPSRLRQWPVQIKLVQERASMFAGADLLIAADCTAYAYGNFHQDFRFGDSGEKCLAGSRRLSQIDRRALPVPQWGPAERRGGGQAFRLSTHLPYFSTLVLASAASLPWARI